MKDPQTREQWQIAVDIAAGLRAIEDCKMYGLLQGGPKINLDRCDELLTRGARMGVIPSKQTIELAADLINLLD